MGVPGEANAPTGQRNERASGSEIYMLTEKEEIMTYINQASTIDLIKWIQYSG